MLKVLVACGCGMGSSQLIKNNCAKVLKSMEVEFLIEHTSIEEAKSMVQNYDVIVIGKNFEKHFKNKANLKVIGLQNLLNKQELKDKLQEQGIG